LNGIFPTVRLQTPGKHGDNQVEIENPNQRRRRCVTLGDAPPKSANLNDQTDNVADSQLFNIFGVAEKTEWSRPSTTHRLMVGDR
jgi:hypothetical protein